MSRVTAPPYERQYHGQRSLEKVRTTALPLAGKASRLALLVIGGTHHIFARGRREDKVITLPGPFKNITFLKALNMGSSARRAKEAITYPSAQTSYPFGSIIGEFSCVLTVEDAVLLPVHDLR